MSGQGGNCPWPKSDMKHKLTNSNHWHIVSVLWPSKYTKMCFRQGLPPQPAGGALDAHPDPPSQLGRGHPLYIPHTTGRRQRCNYPALVLHFGEGAPPVPCWGSSRRLPRPLVGWGGDTLLILQPTRRLQCRDYPPLALQFGEGAPPVPCWGSSQRSPRPPSQLGRGHPPKGG